MSQLREVRVRREYIKLYPELPADTSRGRRAGLLTPYRVGPPIPTGGIPAFSSREDRGATRADHDSQHRFGESSWVNGRGVVPLDGVAVDYVLSDRSP